MAQTKRKRRTKHRGNAAGAIQQRGNTGRKSAAAAKAKPAPRGGRTLKPPTWQSALVKAAMMSVLLFVLTRIGLFGKDVPIAQSAILALFALVMYTPLAFLTDRWAYGRQQRRLASGR